MSAKGLTIALVIAGLLGVGGWLITADVRAEDTEGAEAPAEKVEAQMWTGKIVSVHHYLVRGDKAEAETADKPEAVAAGNPIALLVEESGVLEEMMPGRTVHLIMFDPSDDASQDAYHQARDLFNQNVAVTGKLFERDGLSAISIELIEEATAETVDADAPSPDLGS